MSFGGVRPATTMPRASGDVDAAHMFESYTRPSSSMFGANNRSMTSLSQQQAAPSFVDSIPEFDEVDAPAVAMSSSFRQSAMKDSFALSGRPSPAAAQATHFRDAAAAISALDDHNGGDPFDVLPAGRRRASSVSPADVFGVPRSLDTQQRERERMTGPVTVLNEQDFVVFGGDDDDEGHPGASSSSGRGYVRGTTCKLVLRPGEDVAAIENKIARNTLAPPRELGRSLDKFHVLPDSSLVPAPRTERVAAGDKLPAFLKPAFLEVDMAEQLIEDDDDPYTTALPSRRRHRFAETDGSFDPHATRDPKYVPFAVRPLGHDDVQWKPPKSKEQIAEAERRKMLLSITEATAAERPPQPPVSTRDIAGEYRARQRLVAYDESEAFGFRARPLHDNGALSQLRDDMRDKKARAVISPNASVATIKHQNSCYLISADRRKLLKFDPTDTARNIGGAGMWESMELQDGSLFIGVSAYPPEETTVVPIPNLPYMIATTHSMLYILSLEDSTWFVGCLRGLEDTRGVGWVHLVDEQTLYVRSQSKQTHGLVPLRAVLEELTILRRSPHDINPDQPSFFLENHLKYADCKMLRRQPCPDSLVAVEGVPGVAIQPKLKEGHMWVFVFNHVASTFLPWRRIDNGTFLTVVMENHLVPDSTTILFFAEQLHRMDIGSVVGENVGGGASARRGPGLLQTQRILRVAQRLVIHHPIADANDEDEEVSPRSRQHDVIKRQGRGTYDGSSATTRHLFSTGKSVVLRWKPRGAVLQPPPSSPTPTEQELLRGTHNRSAPLSTTAAPPPAVKHLEDRMELTDLVSGETLGSRDHDRADDDLIAKRQFASSQRVVDLVIKARRNEIHAIVPMHERCAAVLTFDCTTYVVVEELAQRT
ncbi:Hypothetical protein, putative [Bodo saltans]|uniref:Uncharacterized protein n=1 Tax=Bodo saltans TaxID=75058 RepID=A0A0S4INF2_BODSA|nr:Hypothetical protein, putative [Bodo saltans]|eukprot:CUE85333.1 Hypothetical protein, putative [Bodo saltans]